MTSSMMADPGRLEFLAGADASLNYAGTRPEYSATEITDPPATNPVH